MKSAPIFDSLLLLGIFALMLILVGQANCSVAPAATRNTNGLGVVISQDNIFTYNMGLPISGGLVGDEHNVYTSIQFAPAYAPAVNTESLLFCGDVSDDLNKHSGKVVVLTYEKVSHRAFQGIGCHELLSVTDIMIPTQDGTK